MPRFFVPSLEEDTVLITGQDAQHLGKSLRIRPGDSYILSDGKGQDADCTVSEVTRDTVAFSVERRYLNPTEPKLRLHLYQCFPKGDKFEQILQKAVELGAASVTPVLSERSVSRPDAKAQQNRLARFEKISAEAAGQSGRGVIPEVGAFVCFEQAVKTCPKPALFLYEGGGLSIGKIQPEGELSLFIGPEGGFSPEEAALASENGLTTVSLGPRILRTETAGPAALAVLLCLGGEME